jgi:dihydrofolate reductase
VITIVAALGPRGEIGCQGKLPWHLPSDLRHFKRVTWGKPVIMGRRTFESCGPLPGRENIVLSRRETLIPGTVVTESLAHSMKLVGTRDCCVIGGAEVFAEALDHCSYAALSLVHESGPADTFFPVAKFNKLDWDVLARWPDDGWDGVLVRQSPHPAMPFKLETR